MTKGSQEKDCNSESVIIRYDTKRYDFLSWASHSLDTRELHQLHQQFNYPSLEMVNHLMNLLKNQFEEINGLLYMFINEEIASVLGPIASYQNPPSFRVHFHGTGFTPFHRDRDWHGKIDMNIVRRFRNIWIPLTKVWGNNSLWIESTEDMGDFQPIELEYGEALVFDGQNLVHGTYRNDTGATRVSFDFRVLPHS
ncbi:hypothetical protein [Brevibacillus laterosporus]|uniref:hypothetical protein n=1 Tax=Brevibacillus laterosporus TaxID=1465 RepID=UPI00215D385B|nr:hypothetical protein [Brevibacillus laterosporus]MCR8997433.1 hypothetical protein [Brevibacillus laterosporus]